MDAHGGVCLGQRAATIFGLGVVGLLVSSGAAADGAGKDPMHLTSEAFVEGAAIPAKYTCDDKNVSPSLKWTGVPENAKTLSLIADDPDAPMGTWVHWVLFDLPAATPGLLEDVAKTQHLPAGAKQGLNDFRHLGYGGPCPPPGKPHRYFFKIYALDRALDLKPGATRKEVERAMVNHIVAQAQLMGTYQRK